MKKKTYRCTQCGHDFEVDKVMTQEEARDRQMQLIPIRCPKCKSANIREK